MANIPGEVALGEDILSANITSSNTLVASSPCRVRGVIWAGNGTAGSFVLKDGGSSGTARLTVQTPGVSTAGQNAQGAMMFPGGGIRFNSDVYGTLTQVIGLTILYSV